MKRSVLVVYLVVVTVSAEIEDDNQLLSRILGGIDNRNGDKKSTRKIATAPDTQNANVPSDDPCQPYDPPMPNFSILNRRMSQIRHLWIRRAGQRGIYGICYASLVDWQSPVGCCWYLTDLYEANGNVTNIFGNEKPYWTKIKGRTIGAIGWKSANPNEQWVFKCGGTLISSNFVLTAGHCTKVSSRDSTVEDFDPKIVRLGSQDISDPPEGMNPSFYFVDADISQVIAHPRYSPPKKYYDIALIQLEKNVEFRNSLLPACLWTSSDRSSLPSKVIVTGWGVTNSRKAAMSSKLQAAELNIIDYDTCNQLLQSSCSRNWCGLEDHQICAGNLSGGVDSCQGDSGGPLQMSLPLPSPYGKLYYVIGVTSFGIGCARAETPGVYVNVAYFLDWIEDTVWGGTHYI